MITVLHLITGLGRGGAEGALVRLVTRMDRQRFTNVVVSLRDGGVWAETLRARGIELRSLGMSGPIDAISGFSKLKRILREVRPDIVQSWLYHADLMAALAAPSHMPLVWNLRNSDLSESHRASWRVLVALLARLSSRPDVIVANAEPNIAAHLARGYRPRRTLVIPNGVDTSAFAPLSVSQEEARARLGLPVAAFLVGMPARYDDFKDHATFARAAAMFKLQAPEAQFVLAGSGMTAGASGMSKLINDSGVAPVTHLLGEIEDMRTLYGALDLVTLTSSHGEGFPNVVAEAMACARPVVATTVGDTRAMIADDALLAPPRAPQALAAAWKAVYDLSPEQRAQLGMRLRQRAETNFSIDAATRAYEELYAGLVGRTLNR